ncbi:energy-coupling factor ABC transporter ATP-binding protein [Acidaminococcus sp.]|jgi:cobalt/nickel transport system ATP-binding protein|uniref:energy-coupling factor ABC transporter ATP-binding protein n=1 Tax=unclassified Acidaminococcus TaxID=2635771 RepID=UPI002583D865|nr:ABC transporter ATP-binding protein [uncultured Acidaminococcus sp.]
MSAILKLSHIRFQYALPGPKKAAVPVFHDLSFTLEPGEKVGLIGSNGVGKSTLLKLLVGLLPLQAGNLEVCGLPLDRDHLPAIREKTGYVFQDSDSQLFLPTVESDVSFALRNRGVPREEAERRTAEVLAQVGMADMARRQIYRLSGGQKKLTAIAGLLTQKPDLLLMDEPSAALDPRNRRNLIRILGQLPCAQLIASHDLDFIWDTCDQVILLHQGQVERTGPTREILQDGPLLEACGLELPLRLQEI